MFVISCESMGYLDGSSDLGWNHLHICGWLWAEVIWDKQALFNLSLILQQVRPELLIWCQLGSKRAWKLIWSFGVSPCRYDAITSVEFLLVKES